MYCFYWEKHIINREVPVLIKVTKYLYIHILSVLLFVICIITDSVKILGVTYAVMVLHEAAHTLAAVCIGLKISHITIYPFGVNLKLKNKLIYSLSDEIILYISGPMCNAVFALVAMWLYKNYPSDGLHFFYISNITLFVMNMLPALPLDGGFILKKILIKLFGHNSANKIMLAVTGVVSAAVLAVGVYVFIVSRYNFSVILFSMLIVGNVFTQKEKYDIDFVKELMFHAKKKPHKTNHVISENTEYKDLIKQFDLNRYNIVYITDKNGKITDIMTETQIINHLIDTNITSY